MKFIVETKDVKEAKRIMKSLDMALALKKIQFDAWKRFKESEHDHQEVWDFINDVCDQYDINVDELID